MKRFLAEKKKGLTFHVVALLTKKNMANAQHTVDRPMKNSGTLRIFSPERNFICDSFIPNEIRLSPVRKFQSFDYGTVKHLVRLG